MRLATVSCLRLGSGLGLGSGFLGIALGLGLAATSAGCSEEPPPVPPSTAPAPDPDPTPPALDSLAAPGPGRAKIAVPRYDTAKSRFDFPIEDQRARFGSIERVTQLLVGEDTDSGLFLVFYGGDLAAGTYRVLPSTDEVRNEHMGEDSKVFLATLGESAQSKLRSESGEVVIREATRNADGDLTALTGTLDIVLRSQNNLRETTVRADFQAAPDAWLKAELEHQQAIREQLRRR